MMPLRRLPSLALLFVIFAAGACGDSGGGAGGGAGGGSGGGTGGGSGGGGGGGGGGGSCVDGDQDGYGVGAACDSQAIDCADDDDSVHPGSSEVAGDAVDQDCDALEHCYVDADGDGARSATIVATSDLLCAGAGLALASAAIDCADLAGADPACGGADGSNCSPDVALDDCNGVDDDCDGTPDEDGDVIWYADADGDGYGDLAAPIESCDAPDGAVADATDCDDTDRFAHTTMTRYLDTDADGFGDGASVEVCRDALAAGFAGVDGDCDPEDPTAYPGAPELPSDGVDQDCADDGDLEPSDATGIFVVEGATGTAGTLADPVGTIADALLLAAASGTPKAIFVATGSYTLGAPSLAHSIFGGYDETFTTRSEDPSATTIDAMQNLYATASLALERVNLHGGSDPIAQTAYALQGGPHAITVRDARVEAIDAPSVSRALSSGLGTLVVVGSTIVAGAGSTSDAIGVWGSRLVLHRSRVVTHAGTHPGGATSGVTALPQGTTASHLTVVGSDLEIDALGEGVAFGAGIQLANAGAEAVIVNNTVHLGPIDRGAAPGTTHGAAGVVVSGVASPARLFLANNLVTSEAGPQGAIGLAYLVVDAGRAVLRNNDFALTGALDCLVLHGVTCETSPAAVDACDFPTCGVAEGTLAVAPGYTDAARHLGPASACTDAGADPVFYPSLHAFDVDGDGRPFGVAFDIGADEYVE